MLSDRERATWEEIQDQIVAEDPGFAQIFDASVPFPPLPPNPPPQPAAAQRAHRILVWCMAVLSVLLLVAMVGVALFMGLR